MSKHKKLKYLIFLLLFIFIVMDFYPEFKNPDFRYNGSDPNNEVWNLGFPIGLFIYDSNNSPNLFLWPLSYVVLLIQSIIIIGLLWYYRNNS